MVKAWPYHQGKRWGAKPSLNVDALVTEFMRPWEDAIFDKMGFRYGARKLPGFGKWSKVLEANHRVQTALESLARTL